MTVNDHSNTTIVAKDVFGIIATTYGIGKVSVTTAAGDVIDSGASGVAAVNQATAIPVGAASSVSVTANGTIHSGTHLNPSGSQPQGISAGYFPGGLGTSNTNVNGTVLIDNFANVTADAGWGIDAYNYGNGNVTLIDEANTSVSGAQYGIAAYSNSSGAGSSGDVIINVGTNATITAGALYGQSGIAASVNHGGNISITTSNGDAINSGGTGIQANIAAANALASSQISITAAGTINSGFNMSPGGGQPGGMWVGYSPGSGNIVTPNVHGNVVLDSLATINAASGVGIGLYNWGVGNVTATIEASSTVSGVTAGMNVFANGGGNVTITNSGTVTTPSGYGILAGTGNGLATAGTGIISITSSNAIRSLGALNNAVVQVSNWSTQNATFANSANATVTSNLFSKSNLNLALDFYNGTMSTNTGGIIVNNSGQISGNAWLGTSSFNVAGATFNNAVGGVWNVNGLNFFGANTNAINNSGTINATGSTIFSSSAVSSLAFNNSGLVVVGPSSAAIIFGNVSGNNGTFTIGDRSDLEFGGAVATGQTISFTDGNGLLTLDNPSAFHGTISGLAIGDTIDLLGGIIVANASISGSTLTITEANSQTLSYQVAGVQSGTAFNVLSADKIVLVPTTATTITGRSTPYSASPSSTSFNIFANDTISGTGIGINIVSTDSSASDYNTVQINQTSSISVTGAGVNLTTTGANIALINAGSISSSGGAGVFTNSGTGSNDIIDYGNVSGSTVGISARIGGAGPLNIVVGSGATITGTTSTGISAISTLAAIDVTTTSGVTINSGATGIFAQNQGTSVPAGTSSISISTSSGTINAGTYGISASYLTGTSAPASIPNPPNTTVHGDISIDNNATIIAQMAVGINAYNYGVGNISVSSNSQITATAAGATTPGVTATQYGISAFNYGSGNTTVTTGYSSSINSGGTGINIGNQATAVAAAAASTVTVVALGAIHSGANTNNSGSAPSGIQAGFNPNNAGVFDANVSGDVLVNNSANIIADAGDGINAYDYGVGNIAVNIGSGVSIQALTSAASASGNSPYGIGAFNYGPGDIAVTTSNGDVITSGSSGINAVNQATAITAAAGALVTIYAAGSVHSGSILTNSGSQPSGLSAGFLGGTSAATNLNVNGAVIVNNDANIIADAGLGINAYNYGNGDITVNDASGTTVSGAQHGVEAHAEAIGGTGNIAINVYSGATINATSGYGVFAFSNDIGNISIITSAGDVINAGSAGINAVNEAATIPASANSSIVVTAAGTINSGTAPTGTGNPPAGILAGYLGGTIVPTTFPLTTINGDVVVNNSANIIAAAGDGIRAYTYGIGDVTVIDLAGTITALGGPSPTNGFGIGISANNQGSGDIHVSTLAGTLINSGGSGIAAVNRAPSSGSFVVPSTSEVSVLAFGTINSGTILTGAGDPPAGILASYNPNNSDTPDSNVHGNVSVDDYASIFAPSGTDGIRGTNYGTGTITIIAEAGAIISAGRYGIGALGYDGGNVSVTNHATVSGTTAAIDAVTTSTGTAVIDNYGHMVGNVISYNATFTNELLADWSVNGTSTFTGASTLINLGTIDSNGSSMISGLSNIANTGTFEVQSGSLKLAETMTGAGAVNIYGATMEFGAASDAHVQFASSTSGTLVLDDPSHFTGTVTGFASGDTIDLVGIAPANVSVSNSLHVSYGTGSFDLIGNYDPAGFSIVSDNNGGTSITWNHQAPVIATDQISTVQNADGTMTVLGVHLSDSDPAASTETFKLGATTGAAASGSSISPSTSSGILTDINGVFAAGVTYHPGNTPPSTDKVTLTVWDSFGAADTVNFVFNEVGTGTNITLQGTSGKDVIFATSGQDILTGGGGQDQFVFAPTLSDPSLQHTITDFVVGLDKIDVRQFGNISASTMPTETQQGSDTLITLDSHDTLLLKGVVATALHTSDFILHA